MAKVDDLIGVPYVNGGRSLDKGLDCWGLVREYYRREGMDLPEILIDAENTDAVMRTVDDTKARWQELSGPEIGCVILMRLIGNPLPSHCGVYLGYGDFIHAIAPAVQVDRLSRWGPRVVGFYVPKEGAYPNV